MNKGNLIPETIGLIIKFGDNNQYYLTHKAFGYVLVSIKLGKAYMMVTFMCQLDWATRYPDIWSNIYSRCVCDVFG